MVVIYLIKIFFIVDLSLQTLYLLLGWPVSALNINMLCIGKCRFVLVIFERFCIYNLILFILRNRELLENRYKGKLIGEEKVKAYK